MTSPREGSSGYSVERVLAIVSAVLLPLGILIIVLGWYGASHTPYLFEQVPYLISGGILGLGLAIVGGLVYFGSWVARGAAEQRSKSEEVVELLREIRDDLRSSAATAAAPAPRRSAAAGNGKAPFVATAKGGMLHRPDCTVVSGRADLRPVGSTGDGMTPCALCDPLSADVLAH